QTYFHFATQEHPCETLRKVLLASPRPVVTVPEKIGDGAAVLVAYDGSMQAARALQSFLLSGLADGADVHVACVRPNHQEAARLAELAIDFLGFHGVRAKSHLLSPIGSDARTLLDLARSVDAGMLVMGAFGRPTWREFFLGSTTTAILKE